jgi:hypothetical protein
MRRLALAGLVLALHAAPQAQGVPARPLQADAVVRLLSDLETALGSGRPESLTPLLSPTLPAEERAMLDRIIAHGDATVTIRERTRQPADDGDSVLAEVLVARGRYGRVATWQIKAHPRNGAAERFEVADISEVAAVDGLLRLTLDTSKQYAVHNLVMQAPDLTLRVTNGVAFAAVTDDGITALVLRGQGDVRFAPPDPAEQGQLKIFSGKPVLASAIDSAFIRINPDEFSSRISEHSLTPIPVQPDSRDRVQSIFDEMAPKTYSLDLTDLAPDRWSLIPPFGSVVVEFHARQFGWLTYVRTPGDNEDVTVFDRAHQHNLAVYSSADKQASRGSPFYSEDEGLAYDVERYGIDVTVDPVRQFLTGRGSLKIRTKVESLNLLTFRLAESLTVSSVTSPNFGRLLALRVVGQNNFIVSLPQPVAKDTELIVDVTYSGRLNPQTVDHEAAGVEPDQGLTGQTPNSPRGDQALQVDPEPRFLYSNHVYWYPQAPVSDYATAAIHLKVPSEYQVIASGTLTYSAVVNDDSDDTGSREPRSMRVVEYTTDRPARYLSFVISRFVPTGRLHVDVPAVAPPAFGTAAAVAGGAPDTGVNLEVVSTPRMASRNRQLPQRAAAIVKSFTEMVGEAPYPDLTVVGAEDNLPGGHSPPYFSLWLEPLPTTPYNWSNDPLALDSTYPPFFLAHEIAHQWWGQAVGWKNYHEQWLSEGFAQYFAVLYAGVDKGPDLFHALMADMRERAEDQNAQGPIYLGYRLGHIRNDSRVFRAIVYDKAAVVLHMLRGLVGDDVFFTGLKRYYTLNRFKKAGTDDLRNAIAIGTTIKLDRFFQQWIMGSALPKVRVTPRIDSSESATIKIEQIGDVFDFPLTVTVQYENGEPERVTIPVMEAVVERQIPLHTAAKGAVRRIVTRDDLLMADWVK